MIGDNEVNCPNKLLLTNNRQVINLRKAFAKVNKFLLAGDNFIPEMHLKQPGFTYSACGPFTKNRERIQKFKETRDISYIYKKNLIRLVLSMIWLTGILKLEKEERSLW